MIFCNSYKLYMNAEYIHDMSTYYFWLMNVVVFIFEQVVIKVDMWLDTAT